MIGCGLKKENKHKADLVDYNEGNAGQKYTTLFEVA